MMALFDTIPSSHHCGAHRKDNNLNKRDARIIGFFLVFIPGLILMLLIFIVPRDRPLRPDQDWITIPVYPAMNADVQRERGEKNEIIRFTSTQPISTVLQWYDDTFPPLGWESNYDENIASTKLLKRWYSLHTWGKCSYFTLYTEYNSLRHEYTQELSRYDPPNCSR